MRTDRNGSKKNPNLPEGDDGRTIVDMNVEGMPWYMPKEGDADPEGEVKLSPEEVRLYRWAALKAGLLIALIFGTVFFVFIAFCDFIWFR